jgi:hypothetical protein
LLVRFFAIGAVLHAGQRVILAAPEPRRTLAVRVTEGASGADRVGAIDEAILVDLALRAGWGRSDPVVRERILLNLAAVGDVGPDPNQVIERGLAMGIPSGDVIARSRLVSAARRMLERGTDPGPVGDEDVATYLAANPDRFVRPARYRFVQVFVSRDRRGARFDDDVLRIDRALAAAPTATPTEIAALGDPLPLSWPAPANVTQPVWVAADRLDATLGSAFGHALADAPVGAFGAPISSSFGVHFVRVDVVDPARTETVAEAGPRVREILAGERRSATYAARLADLRDRYAVSVETRP